MSLKRLHQIFIVEEAKEATANAALYASNFGSYLVIDPQIEFDLPRYERQINRSSLTRLQGLSGVRQGSMRFGLELTGTSSFASIPQFGLPLRACGFRQEVLSKLTIGAITGGPFRHGETVTQTTSAATGVVVQDTYTGQTSLWVAQGNGLGTGTFNGTNVLTGFTSGATATPSAATASAGYGWWPQSYALSFIRFNATGVIDQIEDGDLLKGVTSGALYQAVGVWPIGAGPTNVRARRISGHTVTTEVVTNVTQGVTAGTLGTAPNEGQSEIPSLSMGIAKDGVRESLKYSRGTVSLSGTIGEPMLMNFEFKGSFNAIADQGNVPGVAFAQTVPPVLIDADLALGHAADTFAQEFVPCIRTIGLAMGNEVNYLDCMADAEGINNTHITARKPTGSFDPDLLPESVWSVMNDFLANTAYRARFSVGTALGNKFLMSMPSLSTTGAPTGDRNGISTRQIAFELTGGSQTISALNVENELVIVAQYL